MIVAGDSTMLIIGLITLIVASFTLLKTHQPFATVNITPNPSGLKIGGLNSIDNSIVTLNYKNATNNNYLKNFSMKGKIRCKGRDIDISEMLPTNIQLAPSQDHTIQIEVQKILEQNGILLDALTVDVYADFTCLYKFIVERKQQFRYKWDRDLALQNQWSPA